MSRDTLLAGTDWPVSGVTSMLHGETGARNSREQPALNEIVTQTIEMCRGGGSGAVITLARVVN